MDKQPTEAQIRKYILAVKHMPLVEGQLESMVILRFDIPDERAKRLVAETLSEARQDELAGIRQRAINSVGFHLLDTGIYDHAKDAEKLSTELADIFFALTVSSGGGKCVECGGLGYYNYFDVKGKPPFEPMPKPCPTCNGTGQKPIVTKTLGEIIKEWEE